MACNWTKNKVFKGDYCTKSFNKSIKALLRNHGITIHSAEEKMGFAKDYFEEIFKGIKILKLEDVLVIADFFFTTLDSVLDGNGNEIRVKNTHSRDALLSRDFEECVSGYVNLLETKAMNYWKGNLLKAEEFKYRVELEKKEFQFSERYRTYMDNLEKSRIHPMRAKEMRDEVLIQELRQRGYQVERK